MSIEAIHFVMKTDIPDGIAKLVAFVIADYAHAETGQAWPKVETLARKCSQSVRTVQRKIRVLEELGVLRVEQRHAETGRQRENLFVLYLPGVPRPAASDAMAARPAIRTPRGEGDTQSPIQLRNPLDPVTPGGDTPDTPGGDTAVTPRGIPQKESTRRIHSEPFGSGVGKPSPRAKLFAEGRVTLMALGLSERSAGDMIVRWLQSTKDDATRVLGAIQHAEAASPHAPIPWITAQLAAVPVPPALSVRQPARHSPHGALSLLARRLGARHDRTGASVTELDRGPVIEHEGDGPSDGAAHQRIGSASDGFPAPRHSGVAGTKR